MSIESGEGQLLQKRMAKGSIPCNECCLPSHTPLGLFPTAILVPSALVAILLSTTDCLSFTLETYRESHILLLKRKTTAIWHCLTIIVKLSRWILQLVRHYRTSSNINLTHLMPAAMYILKMNLTRYWKTLPFGYPSVQNELYFVSFTTIFISIYRFFYNQTLLFLSSLTNPFPPYPLLHICK